MLSFTKNRLEIEKMDQKRRENLAKATDAFLENDDVDAADKALRKAKLSQELQAQYALLSNKRFISSFFIFLCLVILSLLWLFHYPSSRVHLDLEVETAVFRLSEDKDFTWHENFGLKIDRFFADGPFVVTAPGLGVYGNGDRLLVEGTEVALTQLTISKGARLEIERGHDGISLYIYEGGVQCLLEIQEGQLRFQGRDSLEPLSIQSPVPETLRLSTGNKVGHRLHLRLKTSHDWKIYGLQVTDIRFQQETPAGSNNFISSIRKGTIELPETKRKETLLDHDWLHTRKVSSTRLVLNFLATEIDHFDLMFQGRAASIEAGPDEFEQDLAPSLLT
ncbi:MAG: hypothetical protein D3922_13565, partial [Candidatus Electrothrix sp. AR1]|nr:hypothetical protein [Candidatus Electrothrix sp. AR1]